MGGSNILHFGAIRVRATGDGVLHSTLFDLGEVTSQELATIDLITPNNKTFTRLANFITERAMLKFETTDIDAVFDVNDVYVFVAPMWSSYPSD